MVAQGLKVVLIMNPIVIDHSGMIQAIRFIEISKYDGGQLMPRSSTASLHKLAALTTASQGFNMSGLLHSETMYYC